MYVLGQWISIFLPSPLPFSILACRRTEVIRVSLAYTEICLNKTEPRVERQRNKEVDTLVMKGKRLELVHVCCNADSSLTCLSVC